MSTTFKPLFLLFCMCIPFFYWGLGEKPMDRVQEVRVAETARVMVASGDWIMPRYNGVLRLRKPPLAYWLTALSYTAFASVDEFSARFSSATFAVLTTLLLLVWGRKTLGVQAAGSAALAFVSSYIALRYFRSSEIDAILLFFVVAGCMVAYELLTAGVSLRRILLLHLCMGLGFLAKGPAAIAIPLLILLVYSIKHRQFQLWKNLLHPLGLLILAVTAFGWYAWVFYAHPDQAHAGIAAEVDATYITGRHANPVYWYLPRILVFFLPWAVFIIPAAIWLYKQRPHPLAVNFALVWFLVTFTLLSLNISKQVQYALLLNPPLMLLVGYYLHASHGIYEKVNQVLFGILFTLGAALVGWVVVRWGGLEQTALLQLALLLGIGLLPPVLAWLLKLGQTVRYRELLLAGIMASVWIYGQHYWYNDDNFEGQQIRQLTAQANVYAPLYVYKNPSPRVSFYARRLVPGIPDNAHVMPLLTAAGPFYLFVRGAQLDQDHWDARAQATVIASNKGFSLWKITRKTSVPVH